MLNLVHIALGSNLGDRRSRLEGALGALEASDHIELVAVSGVFETEPMYRLDQPPFLNACAALRTALLPEATLEAMLKVEREFGRVRQIDQGARSLDLDLLLAGSAVIHTPSLTLPHPLMQERAFVLAPLVEIAPLAIHPLWQVTIEALWRECEGKQSVRRLIDPLNVRR